MQMSQDIHRNHGALMSYLARFLAQKRRPSERRKGVEGEGGLKEGEEKDRQSGGARTVSATLSRVNIALLLGRFCMI